ncbi:hypothetical protein [Actinomadura sp. 9N407]|uniref:hypothetical protein n=1 Tax=Actinomadura sp. 9N407 TaxID=3375154 RepID=UPI00378981CC
MTSGGGDQPKKNQNQNQPKKNQNQQKNKNKNKKKQGQTQAERVAAEKRKANLTGGGCLVAIIMVVVVGPVLWGMYDSGVFDRNDKAMETAPVFGPKDAGKLVERLSAATKAQGVCYGWVIDSGRTKHIPKVTPSYSGTFRPEAPKPTARPTPPATARPTTPSGARPTPRATAPTPRATVPTPRTTAPRARGTAPATPGTTRQAVPRSPRTSPVPVPSDMLSAYERSVIDEDLEKLTDRGVEYGSNLGVGVDPRQRPADCAKWVVLEADYLYSSQYQEWSSGSTEIKSNLGELEDVSSYDLEQLLGQDGFDDPDDINGDNGIARLADQIGVMPMVVSMNDLAPPVPAPADQSAPPPGDKIAQSDFTARNVFVGIGIALIAGGMVLIIVAAVRNRRGTSS